MDNKLSYPYNTSLFERIPEHLKGIMGYYPDVILFELNQVQYTHLWKRVSSAKYLYTNGYEIRPTNWFMHAFQSFKGWLGFDNHCHPKKISHTLNKLAFYGYMKQFTQPDFSLMTRYAMSPQICALVVNQYKDSTTAELQVELIKSFFKVEPYLSSDYSYQSLSPSHRFGDSWARLGLYELIPLLDPQDSSLIIEVITALDKKGVAAKDVKFLRNSGYARTAAQYYCDKAKNTQPPSFFMRLFWTDPRPGYLAQALAYDSEIAKRDTQKFIEYHLEQTEYQSAFNLLPLLSDQKLILKYLLLIPETERNTLIQKDSPIAAVMAQYYLEKKEYVLAQMLYANIEALSPTAAFTIAINEINYAKAYDIFKRQESTTKFPMSERKALAQVFFDAAEKEYATGKPLRHNKKWAEAEQHYFRSLVQKKAAHHLNPSELYLEELYTHKRLYAMLLIDADEDLYKAEESDLAKIQKAITLLRECYSKSNEEQKLQKTALADGLMRRVDTLREKIAFVYTPHDFDSLKEHKAKYQQEISALIKTLKELITLLTGTKDKELRLKLGKAHYLLADVQDFFDINDSDINQHYRLAMEAVPENPFYVLRISEVFQEEKDKFQADGVLKLKKMGYEVIDFYHWSEERWVKRDHIIFGIKDIHQPAMESDKKGWSAKI